MSRTMSIPKPDSEFDTEIPAGADRRVHRRHDIEQQSIPIDRWESEKRGGKTFGKLVDISAGGVRLRTSESNVKPDHQIRVRLELPAYAGISPFIASNGKNLSPKSEWVGWMTVSRVAKVSKEEYDVAGRLVDMDDIDRGMLGLYLSTQPLAA
jgi:hypothetical protein